MSQYSGVRLEKGHTIRPSHCLLLLDISDLDLVLYRYPRYLSEEAAIS